VKFLSALVIFISLFARADALSLLPVQDGGRIKPYDTFARETLQLLYGKSKFNGQRATEIVFTWVLAPELWDDKEFVLLRRRDIKDALKLPEEKNYFAPKALMTNDRLPLLLQDLHNKLEAKEKLNPYYQDVQRLEQQLGLYRAIVVGSALRVVPPKEGDTWLSFHELGGPWLERLRKITTAFSQTVGKTDKSALNKAVAEFETAARAENPALYPPVRDMQVEVHYNELDPFMWTWILYLVSALFFGFNLLQARPSRRLYQAGWVFAIAGFVLHAYGFGLRCYLTGRPPVSNMYESVVWVSLGTVTFGMIFEAIYRKTYALLGAMLVGVLCQIVASFAPTILDPSLQPLEPVLRSNMWLTIHVLTITLSYSTFFLALLIADLGLIWFLRGGYEKKARELAALVYRVVQVGVVLLFSGTVLGGVWADYSWGRFWGWDPKETWAFIAFMGYIAVLHAKKAGYIRDFGFMISVITAFSLVLMAWYGVNFVLGAGLHSYGFGGGGVPLVAAFVGLHLAYCVFAVTVHRARTHAPRA
jgi:ABC-type transport system involved in cytochrome c biogenesis permease subunit